MRTLSRLLAVAAVLAVPAVAAAHHGWSSYDAAKVIKAPLKVVESRWTSPHGSLVVEYQGKKWDVILAPVARMEARGLTPAEVAVGKTVTLEGYPRSDGTAEMRIERVIVGSKTVELR